MPSKKLPTGQRRRKSQSPRKRARSAPSAPPPLAGIRTEGREFIGALWLWKPRDGAVATFLHLATEAFRQAERLQGLQDDEKLSDAERQHALACGRKAEHWLRVPPTTRVGKATFVRETIRVLAQRVPVAKVFHRAFVQAHWDEILDVASADPDSKTRELALEVLHPTRRDGLYFGLGENPPPEVRERRERSAVAIVIASVRAVDAGLAELATRESDKIRAVLIAYERNRPGAGRRAAVTVKDSMATLLKALGLPTKDRGRDAGMGEK